LAIRDKEKSAAILLKAADFLSLSQRFNHFHFRRTGTKLYPLLENLLSISASGKAALRDPVSRRSGKGWAAGIDRL
jgi:hypothetical protein